MRNSYVLDERLDIHPSCRWRTPFSTLETTLPNHRLIERLASKMASIFTFDPDPPRVSSPWTAARSLPGQLSQYRLVQESTESPDIAAENSIAFDGSRLPILDHTPMIRIEAEPQEGPVEYKLHLLLRKRRSFIQSSTRRNLSGSLRRTEVSTAISVGRSASESNFLASTPPSLSATQSRNYRLEQLTSQMLWRLQQSSSHNTSYSSERVNLQFPDGAQLSGPITTERLYPGLEDSKGALYEIGVSTRVGGVPEMFANFICCRLPMMASSLALLMTKWKNH
jgi:hypothetical protein